MTSNYAAIINGNLDTLFKDDLQERAAALEATLENDTLVMPAFGRQCRYTRDGILLGDDSETGPKGVILSLYALHAVDDALRMKPFKSFKEIPNSMPYQGAFRNRTEMALTSSVEQIEEHQDVIRSRLNGGPLPADANGDFAFVVRPLPKIALCYLFYAADDEFPAAVTCLYSNNAAYFMPTDGLADVGEYTSKAILDMVRSLS
jgi:hypothetical protein